MLQNAPWDGEGCVPASALTLKRMRV